MRKLAAILLIGAGTVAGVTLYVLSILWMLFTGPVRPEDVRPAPSVDSDWRARSNCWWWAIYRFCRHGGILVIRPSGYVPTWHVMWAARYGDTLYEFHPTPIQRGWKGIINAPFHRGRVRRARTEMRKTERPPTICED